MLRLLRRRRGAYDLWQVWTQSGDGRWSTIGAPRSSFAEAAQLARILSVGRTVAVLPITARPIETS
jgi:hypothetical protein